MRSVQLSATGEVWLAEVGGDAAIYLKHIGAVFSLGVVYKPGPLPTACSLWLHLSLLASGHGPAPAGSSTA
ncbi:hypothetical protein PAE0237 [Pyrobaculum aerophilum str. IM2]|uniref:Uncharacterized protein n=2 Tax=Pyrobaculum aerophilum TaxID=13773 RepID=Q8ZZJ0_PYRAE|nr:hypothetical protein [Pyrobaculum aerophilum]AAL62649.1 hypothetical protein PAE0237 [Pyrobaculum aerophilum str. IM2]HII46702.1 hypothetical protein [Pyrobaculum aerophilum]